MKMTIDKKNTLRTDLPMTNFNSDPHSLLLYKEAVHHRILIPENKIHTAVSAVCSGKTYVFPTV